MSKMLILTGCQSNKGGTEKAVANLAHISKTIGFQSVEVMSTFAGAESHYKLPDTAKLSFFFARAGKMSFLKNATLPLLYAYALRRKKPDIVVVCESVNFFYIPFAKFTNPNVRFICWEHFNATVNLCVRRRSAGRWLASLFADRIVVLSYEDLGYWTDMYPGARGRVEVIYNPVWGASTNDVVVNRGERSNLRASRVLLSAGRLEHQKGFDLLIDAWARILPSLRYGWILRIIGDGSLNQSLQNHASELGLSDSVEFAGYVDKFSHELENADLFVMSSRFEGFGFVLVESLAAGVPCVSFRCPAGPSEIIIDGLNGLLVTSGDVGQLAKALTALIGDSEYRDRLQANASFGLERFNWDTVTDRWRILFESVVAPNDPS